MILKKEELLEAIQSVIGDNPTEEHLSFVENISDTYNDLEGRTQELQTRVEETEKEWKKKYTERFFSSTPIKKEEPETDPEDEQLEKAKTISINDLFKYN